MGVIQGVFPSLSSLDSSAAAETDVDVTNFDEVIEVMLAWLLEAEDALSNHNSISDDVVTVKEQFQKHEVLESHSIIYYLPVVIIPEFRYLVQFFTEIIGYFSATFFVNFANFCQQS